MKSNMSDDLVGSYSPGRVFLNGVVAGAVVVIMGTLLVYFLGGWETVPGSQVLWLISPLAAAVAAGESATEKGGAFGRVTSVSFFALVIGFSFSGCSDYLVLWMRVLPSADPSQAASSGVLLWSRHLIVASFSALVGALLDMLFGKRSTGWAS